MAHDSDCIFQVVVASLQQAEGTLVLLVVYGLAALPLTYCTAQLFTSVPTAQVSLSAFAFIIGTCGIIAVKVRLLEDQAPFGPHNALLFTWMCLHKLAICRGTKSFLKSEMMGIFHTKEELFNPSILHS